MLRRVEVEQVEHQQVWPVTGENVHGRLGPDVIAIDDVAARERREIFLRNLARGHELTADRPLRIRPLRKLPRDRRSVLNGHPVDLRGRQLRVVRRVVERANANHFLLVSPRLDPRRHSWRSHQDAVEEYSVLGRCDAGHHRGVIRPCDGGIHGPHPLRRRAASCQPAQCGDWQMRIVHRPAGEAVEADDHDVIGGTRFTLRLCRNEGDRQADDKRNNREQPTHAAIRLTLQNDDHMKLVTLLPKDRQEKMRKREKYCSLSFSHSPVGF